MACPETAPQPYEQTEENQTDYIPQTQQYDYSDQQVYEDAASTINVEVTNDPSSYETCCQNDENTATNSYAQPQNDPQNQQPLPPPPQQPAMQYQSHPQASPTHPNQPVQIMQQYAPQQFQNPQMNRNSFSAQPSQYLPATNNQNNPMRYPLNNPQEYPPQSQPVSYPPTQATNPQANYSLHPQPVSYPPANNPPAYSQQQTANYYPANVQQRPAVVNYLPPQGAVQMMSPSSYRPPSEGIPVKVPGPPSEGWSSGLFDCMNDPSNALITACFPCVTFGQIAEIIDNGHTTCATSGILYGVIAAVIFMPCLISCTYRTKLRSKYGLIESPAPDWAVHCFFEWCALCQEYRELQARGFDPAIGWHGNVELMQRKEQHQMAMTAPTRQTRMGSG